MDTKLSQEAVAQTASILHEHYPCKPDIFVATYEPADMAPTIDPAAIREAAMREAADRFPDGRQPWPPINIRKAILALIGEKK